VRTALAITPALLMLCLDAGAASARTCGGAVACACGDTVAGSATLASDLGVCKGTGLKLRSNAVLDCAGHTITGSDKAGAWYGVFLDSVTGAEVRNCRVTLFRRGLRISGGQGNRLIGNESFANRYGIDVASTGANRIEGNLVRDSRDEGIHVGRSHDVTISGNQLVHNKRENLYLLNSQRCAVSGNTVSQSRDASIFVKHSDDNSFADNQVFDTAIKLRGDSSGNLFTNTALQGEGFRFEAYQDATTLLWTFPHDNQVTGGSILDAWVCFTFQGAYDNHASGVTVDRCKATKKSTKGGQASTGDTVELIRLPMPSPTP
jgi:parallel beta-helix repeat protein